ncbi:MAG: patatin-like phospholipase family protein, partial [Vicinamibacterales bacterium]
MTKDATCGAMLPHNGIDAVNPGEDPQSLRDIEVALSGGGVRASAFSLGVLMYLLDAGLGERIRQVSSVSGGSITNGFLANLLTEQQTISDASLGDFARRLAHAGLALEKLPQAANDGLKIPLIQLAGP